MFGAPDLPRRPSTPAPRVPGFGDHVEGTGGYAGLIVDIEPEAGMATVARRHASGRSGVIEAKMLVDKLRVAASHPLAFDEAVDRDWRRGVLG